MRKLEQNKGRSGLFIKDIGKISGIEEIKREERERGGHENLSLTNYTTNYI